MGKFTIIFLNYNSVDDLNRHYNESKKNALSSPISFIVIDNDPTTRVEDFNFVNDDNWAYISNNENLGYARGNNVGLNHSFELGDEISFVVNPDIVISNYEIFNTIYNKCISTNDFYIGYIKIIGQKVYYKKPLLIEYVIPPLMVFLSKRVEKKGFIYHGSGSFVIMNTKELFEIGFFDDRTFLYFEEDILAEKLIKKRIKSHFFSEFAVEHLHSVSIDKVFNFKKFSFMKQSMKIYLERYRALHKLPAEIILMFYVGYRRIIYAIKNII